MSKPHGTATETALPSTETVLSNAERTNIFLICGLRYGGSSKEKLEHIPLNSVTLKSFDTKNVDIMPSKTIEVSVKAEIIPPKTAFAIMPPIKKEDIAISVGKPLPRELQLKIKPLKTIIAHPRKSSKLRLLNFWGPHTLARGYQRFNTFGVFFR